MPGDSEHCSRPSVAIARAFRRYEEWAVLHVSKPLGSEYREMAGHDSRVPGGREPQPIQPDQPIDWLTRPLRIFAAYTLAGLALVAPSSAGTPGQKS